jgi:acetyl esterase/lipase
VFCPAYRLAPEHPFPAALEGVLEAYRYLLAKGYSHITLCGESAGGGLCYALCLKRKELSLPILADNIFSFSSFNIDIVPLF